MPADPADEEDVALVERCRRGDEAGWAVLVDRYQRLVYTIVLRAGLDEHMAADVFQTVFERLLAHLPTLEQPDRLQAWIVTTARREVQRQRQRGNRTVSMSSGGSDEPGASDWELEDEAPGAEEAMEHLQQLNTVRNAIDKLDDRCRTLLLLLSRDADSKLPYEEVARRMDMSVGSIGPTRSRCLEKLRRLLE